MSHYTVAVFTDGTADVDELLAPYDENIRVAPYIDRTRQEIIDNAKEDAERYRREIAEGKERQDWMLPYLNASTDEEFYEAGKDPDRHYDADGNELSTYNPDSKWDWYQIGGRWDDDFDVYGITCSGTRVGDIKATFDKGAYDSYARFWELYIDGAEPRDEKEKECINYTLYRKEYYTGRYGDKETYAKCMAGFQTFAVVTPDGVWHEPGPMGWFGVSGESDEDGLNWELNYVHDFIESADPDWTLTIVDCHI